MTKNYLTEMLADILDEEHLSLAMKIDEFIRKRWEEADDDFQLALAAFQAKPGNNAAAEFTVYAMLTEAMLENVRTEQGTGRV